MKQKNYPPRQQYEKPAMTVVEIEHSVALLQTSPGGGEGNLPPTGNNNSDNDW